MDQETWVQDPMRCYPALSIFLFGAGVPYEGPGTPSSGWSTLLAGTVSERYSGKCYNQAGNILHQSRVWQHKNIAILKNHD